MRQLQQYGMVTTITQDSSTVWCTRYVVTSIKLSALTRAYEMARSAYSTYLSPRDKNNLYRANDIVYRGTK